MDESNHAMPMKIGDVAKLAELSIDTVRYYEREGLLGKVRRTAAGQRVYDETMIGRLAFVRRTTALGFTLAEVKELVNLRIAAQAPCAGVRRRAEARVADLDRRIAELQAMRVALVEMSTTCRGDKASRACHFLDELARPFGQEACRKHQHGG